MSGRGVMTSRTSVSPKSTIDSSSRRSSRSMRPSCSPASRYACAASPSASSSSGVSASDEADACRSRRSVAMMPTRSSVIGLSGARDDLERRQQRDQHALGIVPDDQQRNQVLEQPEEAGNRQQQHQEVPAAVDAGPRGENDAGQRDDETEIEPHRHEQEHRVVEVGTKTRRPSIALHGQPQRQPHQRAERRPRWCRSRWRR